MGKPRPYDDGNLQKLDSKLEDRTVAILESDVLKQLIDADDATGITYICKAQTGTGTDSPRWQVCRITESGNITMIEWADGNGFFDNIADNRATLDYK